MNTQINVKIELYKEFPYNNIRSRFNHISFNSAKPNKFMYELREYLRDYLGRNKAEEKFKEAIDTLNTHKKVEWRISMGNKDVGLAIIPTSPDIPFFDYKLWKKNN